MPRQSRKQAREAAAAEAERTRKKPPHELKAALDELDHEIDVAIQNNSRTS